MPKADYMLRLYSLNPGVARESKNFLARIDSLLSNLIKNTHNCLIRFLLEAIFLI